MPRRIALLAVLAATPLFSLFVGSASAQDPAAPAAATGEIELESSQVMATPEMWFYQQEMQRYDDPAQAVRRNAEFRAAQRQARIAASAWYGVSRSRPTVNASPFTYNYMPQIARGYGSYYWAGRGVVVRPTPGSPRR